MLGGRFRILVTRPLSQAESFVEGLRSLGFEAYALPLIAIEPVADTSKLQQLAASLTDQDMIIFVSPNAVQQFIQAASSEVWAWPHDTQVQVGGVGPGTVQALRDSGLASEQITAPSIQERQFDSEALWKILANQAWSGRRIMIVRGDGGRNWLAEQFQAAGAQVSFVQAYTRTLPLWSPFHRHLVQQAMAIPSDHLWFFSSSQSLDHLSQLCPQGQAVWPCSRALVTHPRISEHARKSGFGNILLSPPDLYSMVTCIQSAPW